MDQAREVNVDWALYGNDIVGLEQAIEEAREDEYSYTRDIITLLGFEVHMARYIPQTSNTALEEAKELQNLRIFAVLVLIVFSFGFYISYKYGPKEIKAYFQNL